MARTHAAARAASHGISSRTFVDMTLEPLESRLLLSGGGTSAVSAVSAVSSSAADGLTIPTGHARLWFTTPARLAAARQYYAAHPFTPAADDPLGNALRYQLTGNTANAQNAVNQLMAFTISQADLDGISSDTYRWADWVPM